MNINDRLIKLITNKNENENENESEEVCRFLKRGMKIYELFGVIPIMKINKPVPRWRSNRSSCDPYDLHLHYSGVPCYHVNNAICTYQSDLCRINGTNVPTDLDSRLEDLVKEIYCGWQNDRLNVSIQLVTYPDVWYEDYDKTIPLSFCDYIVRLIPNNIKVLMIKVCEELEYLPPNDLLPLGGINYQQGKESFDLKINIRTSYYRFHPRHPIA
jgi:hypothetical protein